METRANSSCDSSIILVFQRPHLQLVLLTKKSKFHSTYTTEWLHYYLETVLTQGACWKYAEKFNKVTIE